MIEGAGCCRRQDRTELGCDGAAHIAEVVAVSARMLNAEQALCSAAAAAETVGSQASETHQQPLLPHEQTDGATGAKQLRKDRPNEPKDQ